MRTLTTLVLTLTLTISLTPALAQISIIPLPDPSSIPTIDILPLQPSPSLIIPPLDILPLPDLLPSSSPSVVVVDLPPVSTFAAVTDGGEEEGWMGSTTTIPGGEVTGLPLPSPPITTTTPTPPASAASTESTRTTTQTKILSPTGTSKPGNVTGTGPIETSGAASQSQKWGMSVVIKLLAMALGSGVLGIFMFV